MVLEQVKMGSTGQEEIFDFDKLQNSEHMEDG